MSRISKTVTITGPKSSPAEHADRVMGAVMILTMICTGIGTFIHFTADGTDVVGAIILGVMFGLLSVIPGALLGMIAYPFAWVYFRLFGDVQIRAEMTAEDETQATRPVSSYVIVRRLDRD